MGAIKFLAYIKKHIVVIAAIVWAVLVIGIAMMLSGNRKEPEVQVTPEPEIITIVETVEVIVEPESRAYYKDISLTDEEMMLVGKIVEAEAGNQTSVGKRAIVEIIFNRMLSDNWPNTAADVITQTNPRQFTEFNHISNEAARANFEYIEAVLREETPILRGDVVYFATYKNANGTHYIQIGDHYFAY